MYKMKPSLRCLFLLVNIIFAVCTTLSAQKLLLPPTFTAKVVIKPRAPVGANEESLFHGLVTKADAKSWALHATLESSNNNDKQYVKYHDGRMQVGEDCVQTVEDIFPNDVLNQEMIDNAVKIEKSSTLYDREVDLCQQQGLDTWLLDVQLDQFILCTERENSQSVPKRIIGSNLVIEVVLFNSLPAVGLKAMVRLPKCPQTKYKLMSMPSFKPEMPWFHDARISCQHDWLRNHDECKGLVQVEKPSKTCIFLHGVGQGLADKGDPVSEFREYWGNVHLYTPQCKERIFIREETKLRGWDNIELQKSYCNVSLSHQKPGDTVIRNKILFVHSMGNLVLAGAIQNKLCSIDHATTSWYSIQSPFTGSKASATLSEVCQVIASGKFPAWTQIYKLYKKIADMGGYCVPHSNQTYPAYKTIEPGYPGLQQIGKIITKEVKGSMCGVSPFGLYSAYSPVLAAIAFFVQFGEFNDGMVNLESCQRAHPSQNWHISFEHKFYVPAANHADGTCRNSDGMWGFHRKPCSYYVSKT